MNASPIDPSKTLVVSIKHYPYDTLSKSMNNDDEFDCVKVEISDLDNSCPNQTILSLMRCQKQILVPFRRLLCLIGWRPFGADSWSRSSILFRLINVLYPICILLLLLFNYAYEVISCQGKLNVVTDTKVTPITTTVTTTTNTATSTSLRNESFATWATLRPGITPPFTINATNIHSHGGCGHVFTTYILPDIFHFVAFIIGLIHFRVSEGEPMYSLMEKVFIHADQNIRLFSPNRAIRRLKLFMLIGCAWTMVSVGTHALSNAMNDFAHTLIFGEKEYYLIKQSPKRYILFAIDIICLLISNCIHVAVVMNYVCHCEMIIFYCKAIRTRLEEKSIHLIEAMKQIVDLGVSIGQLNSAASRMMTVLLVLILQRTMLGFILLVLNRIFKLNMWIYRSLYTMVWFSILLFCLGQAARVTSKCDKFHRISLSMRVYGYRNATNSELDGFLMFLSEAKLRAKLFGLTVRPGKIIFLGVAALLTFVVLFQTSIISDENFFF